VVAEALARTLDTAAALCAQRGARLTPQRRRVLEILCRTERPLGAYEILDQLREGSRVLAPPTVYRALDFLLEQGLAHRLESQHAFIGCRHPERVHQSQFLICARCGRVTELADAEVSAHLAMAARACGFEAERPVVELIGICAGCASAKQAPDCPP